MSCFNCGSDLPQGARFCPLCGAPVEGDGVGSVWAASSWELCEIGCWHGYLKADFYARRIGQAGEELARSRMFFCRSDDPPRQKGKALAAHQALVAKLRAYGWEPVGQARPWYAQRFRRQIAGVYDLPAEAPPEERPESPPGTAPAEESAS